MGKQKQPTLEIPKYNKPNPQQMSLPGLGTSTYANDTWGFNQDPELAAQQKELRAMQNSILAGLGVTAPEREASLNNWQDTFMKEAQRTSQPALEQSLFQRGLGGSKFYQDSVTDLLSKLATQSVLNREQLANQDYNNQLAGLQAVTGLNQTNYGNMSGLLGNAVGQTNQNNQQAWNQYQTMLPYTMKVNTPGNNGLMGALQGAATGFMVGGPIGAVAGGGLGYLGSKSSGSSTPYIMYQPQSQGSSGGMGGLNLSSLAGMFGGGGGGSSNAGYGMAGGYGQGLNQGSSLTGMMGGSMFGY